MIMMMMMMMVIVVSSGLMQTQTQIIRTQTICHCEEKRCAATRTAS